MHKMTCFWFFLWMFGFSPFRPFSLAANTDEIEIGLILDGPYGQEHSLIDNIKKEILDLLGDEFTVQFPASKTVQADWTLAGINKAINDLWFDSDVDLIIPLGIISGNELCRKQDLPKPVIVPYVLDAEAQKLSSISGTSGKTNLDYISVPSTFKKDIQLFKEIIDFHNLGIIISQYYLDALPELAQNIPKMFPGLEVSVVSLAASLKDALLQIPENIEAVYVLPLPQLSEKAYFDLVSGLIDRKLPSFSFVGAERVELGLFAGLKKDVVSRISRRVALNVQRILLGEKPETLPVAIAVDEQLVLNMDTANAIGISPAWAVVTEAEVIEKNKQQIERNLDLFKSVQEALAVNLDLTAKEYYVLAGEQNIHLARAKFLPALDLSGTYLAIDKDRAEQSFGQQAERTLIGSLTATQIIFSEPLLANLAIQKNLYQSRVFERNQLKLDIIRDAATSYLNVMRAKTFERIQQENLRVTRKNLDFARVREFVGSAGPAEVYRWESEIASNRISAIRANTQRNLAEIQLNRLLHRPAEESFITRDVDLTDPSLITSYQDIYRFIENKKIFKYFREFMSQEALNNSPELAAFDAAISIQQRIYRSAVNSFWSPTIALQGQVNNTFSRAGAGKESAGFDLSKIDPQYLPIAQSFGMVLSETFQPPKDLSWNVGLNVSIPLFMGGEKFMQRQKAAKELKDLQLQRDALAERIEQRVRSALHVVGLSYASIKQAQLAAEAAKKSLQVVQDAYSQGLVSTVELLDAQRVALINDQVAANSVYDFLIDLMEVERALGKFSFLSTDELRNAFLKRVFNYFEKVGVQVE